MKRKAQRGKVYLIGAGPGDPELITLKGATYLKEADVVVYDYLVAAETLEACNPEARIVYVGKSGSHHTVAQEEINRLLVKEAKNGHIVARLKGGDPFIFGRGGEEAMVLAEAGIPFEIVPGVTSAIGVPASAGIPLTHRGYTSTVAFVTGHEDPKKGESAIDWEGLAHVGTIVFLMGVKKLPLITRRLIRAGKSPETPAAVIRWGTTPEQETLVSTLKNIAHEAKRAGFTAPAVLVIGNVVSLRTHLNWYEHLPLFGQGIVVTRPTLQADSFRTALRRLGARVLLFPTIAIRPPKNWRACDRALAHLADYQWIIFTSANGVKFFLERLDAKGSDVRALQGIRIAAIGPATAYALATRGIRADLCPAEFTSEGLIATFDRIDINGAAILLPRAAEAGDVLPRELAARGARVKEIPVYRTIGSQARREEFLTWLAEGRVSCLTFTSPSTFHHFREIMGDDFRPPSSVTIAVIGPVTSEAVRKTGWNVHIQARPHTVTGLVASLIAYFHPGPQDPEIERDANTGPSHA